MLEKVKEVIQKTKPGQKTSGPGAGAQKFVPAKRVADETDKDVSPLGQPLHFEFSGKTAPNRFLKAAMSERLASWDPQDLHRRGIPTPELITAYQRWGEGGHGLILTGNLMVDSQHLEAPGNIVISRNDTEAEGGLESERFRAYKELATQAKKHGSLIVAQLSHPGRQTADALQPHPISASDVQLEGTVLGFTFAKPKPMTKEDIEDVVDRFAYAAEFLHKAGYDGVQLHGAHGYLLAQYLATSTNKRTDEYGGPLMNRARIIFDIARAIRRRVPDRGFSIGIKLNSVEFQEGGFSPDECGELCVSLQNDAHFDFVELSGGTYQSLAFAHKRESTRKREAFFLDFADSIVPRLDKTKVYVTGGFRTAGGMVDALRTVHGVGLARPVCNEFDLPDEILHGDARGIVDVKLDQDDFGITNVAAGTQIRLVGNGKQPLDMSRDDHVDAFKKSMEKWNDMMTNDNKDGSKSGYIDIESVDLHQYGSPYVAS